MLRIGVKYMENYAIVLGVPEYTNASDLQACKNDADLMCELLSATEKYKILRIDENLRKTEILEKIDSFIEMPGTKSKVGEIFFYFSGHGYQDETDMHYILKDTELKKINATALNNNELDDIIREKNPELFVKIIDACESGLSYIKSLSLGEYFEKRKHIDEKIDKTFENCIFMSSSKKNEYSEATNECSYFTKVFIDAVLEGIKAGIVRYSDIQNYIRDEFTDDKYDQTPFFNLQSDGRAIFTYATEALKKLACRDVQQETGNEEENTLETKINNFLKLCRSQEQVEDYVKCIENYVETSVKIFGKFENHYETKILDKARREFETDESILNFLYDKRRSENIYVKFETEKRQKNSYFDLPFLRTETVPVKFWSIANSLPSFEKIKLEPKDEALPVYEVSIIFVYSDIGMYIFVGAQQLIYKGWNEYVVGEKKKYKYFKLEYSEFDNENWKDNLENNLQECVNFIEASLSNFVSR